MFDLRQELFDVLSRAQEFGFLGPAPVEGHIEHSLEFVRACEANGRRDCVMDLGSGGGVPGLVLGVAWQESTIVLLEANARRAAFLRRSVDILKLTERVAVLAERAETAARDVRHRGQYDLLVARGFGGPAVVAECGAPFLRTGGTLIVSEPPPTSRAGEIGGRGEQGSRWPVDGLSVLGLTPARAHSGRFGFQLLEMVSQCPDRYPRRVGVPAKRPLF